MKLALLTLNILGLTSGALSADSGPPLNSSMSPTDASAYLDNVMGAYMRVHGAEVTSGIIQPSDINQMAATVSPMGTANLLACFSDLPPDATGSPTPQDPAVEVRYRVLLRALGMMANEADIDALTGQFSQRARIVSVFFDHKEWDASPKVGTFINAGLKQIADTYQRSLVASRQLIMLAARNPNPGTQDAFEALVSDAVANDASYENAHIFSDLLGAALAYPQSAAGEHLADILTLIAKRVRTDPTDIYLDISPEFALNTGGLVNQIITQPTLAADPRIKQAFLDLAQNCGHPFADVLIPAAASGDGSSLAKLGKIYLHPDEILSDLDVHDSTTAEKNLAGRYLKTVMNKGTGASGADPIADIVNHLDAAVYDPKTCLWTIPAGDAGSGGLAPSP